MGASADRMRAMLPAIYADSTVVNGILDAVGAELDLLFQWETDNVDGLWNQASPITSTWAIGILEDAFGLPSGSAQPIEQRRSAVLARMLGPGTATVDRVTAIANAYQNGSVLIDMDWEGQQVLIWFDDFRGAPPNLDNMLVALRAIVPAHIQIVPIFVYNLWNMIDDAGLTWDQFDALAMSWDDLPSHTFA